MSSRHLLFPLLPLLLLGLSTPALAIVNIESARVKPQQGWSGQVSLGVQGASGNTDKTNGSLSVTVFHHNKQHQWMLLGSREYGKSNEVKDTDNAFAHLRYNYLMSERFAYETFVQYQSDEFRRLEDRELLGFGGRWTFPVSEQSANVLGAGVFHSWEQYDSTVVDEEQRENLWRANFYWVYKTSLNKQLNFSGTFYLQPGLEQADNNRILAQSALRIKMTDMLDFVLKLNVVHDSEPPRLLAGEPLEKTDIKYSTAFEMQF